MLTLPQITSSAKFPLANIVFSWVRWDGVRSAQRVHPQTTAAVETALYHMSSQFQGPQDEPGDWPETRSGQEQGASGHLTRKVMQESENDPKQMTTLKE